MTEGLVKFFLSAGWPGVVCLLLLGALTVLGFVIRRLWTEVNGLRDRERATSEKDHEKAMDALVAISEFLHSAERRAPPRRKTVPFKLPGDNNG